LQAIVLASRLLLLGGGSRKNDKEETGNNNRKNRGNGFLSRFWQRHIHPIVKKQLNNGQMTSLNKEPNGEGFLHQQFYHLKY
jgi:hypothetical protein